MRTPLRRGHVPVVAILVGALSLPALAQARRGGPVPSPAGIKALRDLEYAVVDGNRPLLLDLYVPEKADGPLPLVVWVHGGGWEGGNKNNCPALPMCLRGYAAASVEYRLSNAATFPAQIHDCKGAIRWLRANAAKYNLDSNRIGVWGSSAGGHLVALLGVGAGVAELEGKVGGNLDYSSRVQAVCDFFGPADLTPLGDPNVSRGAFGPVTKLLGGPVPQKKELAALASPVTHATKDAPPFLIMHGDKDNVVPLSQSQALQDALKKAGADSTLVVVKNAGHGFAGAAIDRTVHEFFAKHLGKAAPAATSRPASP